VADDRLSTFYTAVTVRWSYAGDELAHVAASGDPGQPGLAPRAGVTILDPETGCSPRRDRPAAWPTPRASSPGTRRAPLDRARRQDRGGHRNPRGPSILRYLSNRSSGKMGYAIAGAAARRGARVILVSGPVSLAPPWGVELVSVCTSAEMREAALVAREGADAVFMAAAVADYVPAREPSKIKKSAPRSSSRSRRDRTSWPSWGASSADGCSWASPPRRTTLRHARAKLERKGADFIVANDVAGSGTGFEADDNAVTILGRAGEAWEVPRASKAEIAEAILDRVLGAVPEIEPA
jgi:hypothetical protein